MTSSNYDTFADVKKRLDEIVDAVSDDTMPLDDALALYEEAVTLGLRASDLLEKNIEEREAQEAMQEQDAALSPSAPQGDAGAAAGAAE